MNNKPRVGVLATVKFDADGFPIGKEADIIKQKFAAAQKYGIDIFIFFAKDIIEKDRIINGYVFVHDKAEGGHWERKLFPFPDIIYNRIRSRNIEKHPPIKQLLQILSNDPNIKLFNTRFLDKWEVCQALKSNPFTSEFLPPTAWLSYSNLQVFSDKYDEVFIKPTNNNAGRGIIKIICNHPHAFSYCPSDLPTPHWHKTNSISGLWNNLLGLIKDPDNYIIQKGIDLCRINEQVFDLRAQVQKNGYGQWVFTGINVRVARENRFVTYPKVGQRVSYKQAIHSICNGNKSLVSYVEAQLQDIYYYVPRILEKNLNLSLGILSIDIGIDYYGKPWVIEVSSKSDYFSNDKILARHFKYLMEYFVFLTHNNQISDS
ncbi:MAG: YheC/YheD family protein [Syntrophomonas sp.]|nr:YheC/YheD family protein [Syntrophomonas sp.]